MTITFQVTIDRQYNVQVFRETLEIFSLSINQNILAPVTRDSSLFFSTSLG